jgi:hypothetical protein
VVVSPDAVGVLGDAPVRDVLERDVVRHFDAEVALDATAGR